MSFAKGEMVLMRISCNCQDDDDISSLHLRLVKSHGPFLSFLLSSSVQRYEATEVLYCMSVFPPHVFPDNPHTQACKQEDVKTVRNATCKDKMPRLAVKEIDQ